MRSLLLSAALIIASLPHPASAALAPSPEAARPLAVGTAAPDVAVKTVDGAAFPLATAFAEKPTVLIFYRGSWCPYCNRHLAALAELEPQLLALGFQVLAISPDTPAGLRQAATKNQLNYRLLSDRAMVASPAFGVAFRVDAGTEKTYRGHGIELAPVPGGEGTWLPVPAVFIVDRARTIRFVHSQPDYKVRLSAPDLLAAARAVAGKN